MVAYQKYEKEIQTKKKMRVLFVDFIVLTCWYHYILFRRRLDGWLRWGSGT